MNEPGLICPKCQAIAIPGSKFCVNCGFQLVEIPQVISIGRQIYIYIVSLLLPPFGLVWTFKYFRKTPQQKRIAYIALFLTVVSIIFTIWFSVGFFQTVQQSVQQQLNPYPNLGL